MKERTEKHDGAYNLTWWSYKTFSRKHLIASETREQRVKTMNCRKARPKAGPTTYQLYGLNVTSLNLFLSLYIRNNINLRWLL